MAVLKLGVGRKIGDSLAVYLGITRLFCAFGWIRARPRMYDDAKGPCWNVWGSSSVTLRLCVTSGRTAAKKKVDEDVEEVNALNVISTEEESKGAKDQLRQIQGSGFPVRK